MKKLAIVLFGVFIINSNVLCQDVKVELVGITDNRGTGFFARCEVKLKFKGPGIQNAQFQKMDAVLTAIDDKDNNLAHEDSFGMFGTKFQAIESGTDELKWELTLHNPARSASTIKLLKGTLLLFNANLDPESQHQVKGFSTRPNESLLKGKTTESLDVVYLNDESYRALAAAEKEKVKKLLEVSHESQEVKDIVSKFFDYVGPLGNNELSFFVRDTESKIMAFAFKDGNGENMEPESTMRSDATYTCSFPMPIAKDWTVIIYFNSSKALELIPFELRDIKLP